VAARCSMSACEPQSVVGVPPASTTCARARASPWPQTEHTVPAEPERVDRVQAAIHRRIAPGHEAGQVFAARLDGARDAISLPAKMAEASPTAKPRSKPKTGKKASAGVPPPPDGGLLSTWRVWGGAGLLLVGSVIAWRLLGVSFRADIETICNGEKSSGYTAEKDMVKVTQWVRDHLGTPEGNQFYSTMSDVKMAERAKLLQSKAAEVKVDPCPMVPSLLQVAAEGEYRADLQHLCSRLTFPKLDEMDDDTRAAKLLEWIDQQAKSPRTKELADPIKQAATPADRGRILSEAAGKVDVFSCETSKTLNLPQQAPKVKGAPSVRPYAPPQIIGSMPDADLAKSIVEATPAMNQCYAAGIVKKPDLEGRMAVKLQIDPSGKAINAALAESKMADKDTAACIVQSLREAHWPKNPGPLVSVLMPLELTTTVAGSVPAASARPTSGPVTLPQEPPTVAPSGSARASSAAPSGAH